MTLQEALGQKDTRGSVPHQGESTAPRFLLAVDTDRAQQRARVVVSFFTGTRRMANDVTCADESLTPQPTRAELLAEVGAMLSALLRRSEQMRIGGEQ